MGVTNATPFTPAENDQQSEGKYSVVLGKTASELTALFNEQSAAIRANPELRFERTVNYGLVECDIELSRMPLDALSLGIVAQAYEDNSELSENFIMSLLLATGTLSRCTIDVPFDSTIDPALVLQEAEAQGLNVRVMLPPDTTNTDHVSQYTDLLAKYAELWLESSGGNYSLTPLDGYLEYKFSVAIGHVPKSITMNSEMRMLFTDDVTDEAMDFIKNRLDVVINDKLGGDEYFKETSRKVGAAIYLKEVELREARIKMLEEELDARTPVPNLIRAVSKMTGLRVADAAGMVYELKNSIHAVLDKYLPYAEGEEVVENKPSPAQYKFAESISKAMASGFGGKENLAAAWKNLTATSQLNKLVDLDRGVEPPSKFAEGVATGADVSGKVAALAIGELTAMFGTILKAGGAIEDVGLERPSPMASVHAAPANNIIAKG